MDTTPPDAEGQDTRFQTLLTRHGSLERAGWVSAMEQAETTGEIDYDRICSAILAEHTPRTVRGTKRLMDDFFGDDEQALDLAHDALALQHYGLALAREEGRLFDALANNDRKWRESIEHDQARVDMPAEDFLDWVKDELAALDLGGLLEAMEEHIPEAVGKELTEAEEVYYQTLLLQRASFARHQEIKQGLAMARVCQDDLARQAMIAVEQEAMRGAASRQDAESATYDGIDLDAMLRAGKTAREAIEDALFRKEPLDEVLTERTRTEDRQRTETPPPSRQVRRAFDQIDEALETEKVTAEEPTQEHEQSPRGPSL